jgi:hypothetical protein
LTAFVTVAPSGDIADDLLSVSHLKLLRNRLKRVTLKAQLPSGLAIVAWFLLRVAQSAN